ncbi:WhiB family transcriptional regulator [Nocardia veterana]|uniref:WhiB family transcriptional regulator n=1 Tax=Nocardia veterana TaxID=132249 RepID=A0A7X6RIG1_9NOCA|nr:WhiB family transcriptional regulator [Nocardia veterana]
MNYRWAQDAACRMIHPEVFFPCRDSRASVVAQARAICELCRVRRECARFALEHAVVCGVFAGVDLGADGPPKERALQELRRIANLGESEQAK